MGLNEASLFNGASQDIDALHFDPDTENLLISVLTSGAGTVASLAYSEDQGDLIEIDPRGVASAIPFLEGDGLHDGKTRQLNAAHLPAPSRNVALWAGGCTIVDLPLLRPTGQAEATGTI
jgi:hypothetical protein